MILILIQCHQKSKQNGSCITVSPLAILGHGPKQLVIRCSSFVETRYMGLCFMLIYIFICFNYVYSVPVNESAVNNCSLSNILTYFLYLTL